MPNGDLKRLAPQRGFTYLTLMIMLMVIGLMAAAGLKMGSLFQRAAQEEELLEIGAQFSEALRSYAAATPPGKPQQPPTLQDLLRDPRFPNVRRHLRKMFVDPVTGQAEWGVVYLGDKVGVVAIHSLSQRKPLKVANFDLRFTGLENKERISDWKFVMAGGEGSVGGVVTPPNSMVGSEAAAGGKPGESLFPPGDGKERAVQAPAAGSGSPAATPPPMPAPRPEEEAPPEAPPVEEENKPEVEAEEKQGRNRDDEEVVAPGDLLPPVERRLP